jgi:hypothetical protein
MNRRRIDPRTRQEQQRTIERMYNGSGLGLLSDLSRVPQGGFGELYNARDFKTEVRGRQGSFLHSGVDAAIFPEDLDDVTLVQCLESIYPNGTWAYKLFMLYSHLDTINVDFQVSKNLTQGLGTITAYDIFEAIPIRGDAPSDVPIVKYKGSLMPPSQIDGVSTDITRYEVKSGGTIALYNWPTLTTDCLGTYFKWGYSFDTETEEVGTDFIPQRDYIIGYTDGDVQTIQVQEVEADGVTITSIGSMIQPIIHASLHLQEYKKAVILAGKKIYETNVPFDGWREVFGIYDSKTVTEGTVVTKQPFPAESLFHEVNGEVLLTNVHGHYRIRFDKNVSHYWKINESAPNTTITPIPRKIWGFRRSVPPEGAVIVGFPGYSPGPYSNGPMTGNRAGETFYFGGQIT